MGHEHIVANLVTIAINEKKLAETYKTEVHARLAEAATEAAGLIKAMRWRSVEDELPDPLLDVLTIDSMGNYFVDFRKDDSGEWEFGQSKQNPITHWCYLPEAPGGEKEA